MGMPVRFVEKSGYSLQNMLEQANPFKSETCGRVLCFPCQSERGGDCEKRGAGYKVTCQVPGCKEDLTRYDGETGKNGYSRGVEHKDGYRGEGEKNMMWKHALGRHEGNKEIPYKMTVLKTFGKDNIKRKVDEALRITRNKGVKLNSKAEFRQPSIPRLVILGGSND
jgi:hypothetical protein